MQGFSDDARAWLSELERAGSVIELMAQVVEVASDGHWNLDDAHREHAEDQAAMMLLIWGVLARGGHGTSVLERVQVERLLRVRGLRRRALASGVAGGLNAIEAEKLDAAPDFSLGGFLPADDLRAMHEHFLHTFLRGHGCGVAEAVGVDGANG